LTTDISQVQYTDAESLEETQKSNTEKHRKPEQNIEQKTVNPPSDG